MLQAAQAVLIFLLYIITKDSVAIYYYHLNTKNVLCNGDVFSNTACGKNRYTV